MRALSSSGARASRWRPSNSQVLPSRNSASASAALRASASRAARSAARKSSRSRAFQAASRLKAGASCIESSQEYRGMKLLVLPGDGIGPEITRATLAVLQAAGRRHKLDLSFEERDIGLAALKKHGTTLPDGTLDAARAADGVILGPLDQLRYPPADQGGLNPSAIFRVKLDLYANVRPARSRAGLGRPMDLVIMRECTEG